MKKKWNFIQWLGISTLKHLPYEIKDSTILAYIFNLKHWDFK
jgi:hypothetical protein